ncbi:hypothetical protein [Novosphingobium album (ex Liu et al. 2023)]|uniref:Uncharacterized protein n=1 Tax=Novosphingobium album (ex Liu et al. 2023) TaxID=3031130 RepID=A0ABT5WTA3_9SPHN|nr:hypothetical protein [Novosphingobium album (ex Liu et al. 2023)]MDE8652827.1 hypothetical protein [Novosphingobium album (ex Liu et al. 2023)]
MNDGSTERLPQGTAKLGMAMAAAIILSVAGIAYAIWFGVAADGGRGGAIAVGLTFFILFMGRGTAETALEASLPPAGDPLADLEQDLARVRGAVAAMLDWSRKEKVYLTVSSVVGTLAWGFGDVVAKWLGAAS